MKLRFTSQWRVWAAVVMQLCSGLAWACGLMVCVAADGHIALEPSHARTSCRADFDRHHPGEPDSLALDTDGHGCRDIMLGQDLSRATCGTDRLSGLEGGIASIRALRCPAAPAHAYSVSADTAGLPRIALVAMRRTVVLLV